MVNLFIAFVTGLTTGGLSCLAVQGGLLASSLAGQIEQDVQKTAGKSAKGRKKYHLRNQPKPQSQLAQPIAAFLAAKLLAYTLLGFLLGWVGQIFQLSPYTRAFLQIGIGIFMLGTALRMLNVHPIFRYFAFEPPAWIRRKLRRTAAAGASAGAAENNLAAPLTLGFLTVLIPCGVTQAMMAAALGTGSPLQGAALMLAFTLGTSPVFFAVAYFATQLGKRLEKNFMRLVAVTVLILAIVTIDSGITLAGSPVSLSRLAGRAFRPSAQAASTSPAAQLASSDGSVITVQVENNGYSPEVVHAKAGVPVTLQFVTNNTRSCSRSIIIPALNVQKILESTGVASIAIPPQPSGASIPYSCSMGMYSGTIVFDL